MPRRIRQPNPEYIRMVTIRTHQSRLFMTPRNRAIADEYGGIIARYQEIFGIEIFAYVLLSNHYHILLRGGETKVWRFQQAINREIARRTNVRLARKDTFWNSRYSELICPNDEDSFEALLYITCNPTHHALVHHPRDWPGLSSYNQLLDEKPRTYPFIHWSKFNRAKRLLRYANISPKDYATYHTLRISPLPSLATLPQTGRRKKIIESVKQRVGEIRRDHKENEVKYLGQSRILRQDAFSTPVNTKTTRLPICYSKNPETKKQFRILFRVFLEQYQIASKKFLAGARDTIFPNYAMPPPLHCAVSG